MYRITASAMALESRGGTRSPVFSLITNSGIPEISVEITGHPPAIASIRETGIPSMSPSLLGIEGRINMSAERIFCFTSSWEIAPRKESLSLMPRDVERETSRLLHGPFPATSATQGISFSLSSLRAPTRYSNPFLVTKRPTEKIRTGDLTSFLGSNRNFAGEIPQ